MTTEESTALLGGTRWERASPSGFRHGLRTVSVVVRRESIRFVQEWGRALALFVQGLLWLFVISVGFGSLLPEVTGDVHLGAVLLPGVITMIIVSSSLHLTSSIVVDRQFGFLREMLVAPVSRTALALGNTVAAALLSGAQGLLILVLGGLVGVPYDPRMLVELTALVFLTSFTVSAFGVMIAAGVQSIQGYYGVTQLAVMPLILLSGALFPIGNLPGWLSKPMLFNPITYTVDPMRQAVLSRVATSPEVSQLFNPGIFWGDWPVPVAVEILLVLSAGLAFLGLAALRFRRIV